MLRLIDLDLYTPSELVFDRLPWSTSFTGVQVRRRGLATIFHRGGKLVPGLTTLERSERMDPVDYGNSLSQGQSGRERIAV